MSAALPALSTAAAGLRFHRREHGGGQDAQVLATRPVLYPSGQVMYKTTDSVTFRVVPAEVDGVRTGWRCILFAGTEVIYDDRGRVCSKLAVAKAYLRRLADDPMMQDLAMRALTGEGGSVWKQFDARHDAFLAALDDHHGAPVTERA